MGKHHNTRSNKIQKKKKPELKEGELPNVDFYSDLRKSEPEGDYHKTIISEWFGNRKILEYHHGYIQWLFPTTETSLNDEAYQLSPTEIEVFCKSEQLQKKLIMSFQMMLDFYGMNLTQDGKITRHEYYQERYRHLNKRANDHNFMRITRIIKCLCLCGLESYAVQFVKILVEEIFIEKTFTNLQVAKNSCKKFFIPSLPKQYQQNFFDIINEKNEKKK
eukprot:gene12266-5850_t